MEYAVRIWPINTDKHTVCGGYWCDDGPDKVYMCIHVYINSATAMLCYLVIVLSKNVEIVTSKCDRFERPAFFFLGWQHGATIVTQKYKQKKSKLHFSIFQFKI